jgi:NAD(P)-dependent dehydrogenase (short-subunit alcohol dehydrogenase family)
LAQHGAKVVLADINDALGAKLESEMREKGHEALYVHTNVAMAEERTNLVDRALEAFGTIDILVTAAGCHSLAGQGTGSSFPDILEEDWDLMFDVHLKGTFFTAQEVARRVMIPNKRGRIVYISSLGAHGKRGVSAYGTAKAAISFLTARSAVALGKYGINVNCVSPGMVLTPIFGRMELKGKLDEPLSPEFHQMMTFGRVLEIDRYGTGLDIAKAILFLVSDLGEYVTGVDLNVSAGQVFNT